MKIGCPLVLMLILFGCSPSDSPDGADAIGLQDSTLTNLVYVDELSVGCQHPLVCGPGRDFPDGREMVFRQTGSDYFIHAVFPEEMCAPEEPSGSIVLQGHFQRIQNRTLYTQKIPPEDYSYFVVSSWELR